MIFNVNISLETCWGLLKLGEGFNYAREGFIIIGSKKIRLTLVVIFVVIIKYEDY